MPRYRHYALIVVSYEHEARDFAEAEMRIAHMSVMDWTWQDTVNTISLVETKANEWKPVEEAEQMVLLTIEE